MTTGTFQQKMNILGIIHYHRSLGLQSPTLANSYHAHIFLSCTSRPNFPKQDYQREIQPQHSQFHMFQLGCQKSPNLPLPLANPRSVMQLNE